ncbi:MAG: spermidine/putrescine ABC transporter permease PotC, partial [Chloroflexi bacterium]|nr:spermidine/putrescine ABC transporter permease PotC [Chloroflexota bacterium]
MRSKHRKPMSIRLGRRVLTLHGLISYFFLYAPMVILLIFSFNASRFASGTWKGFTLNWYIELFQDEAIGAALRNSLYIGFVSTLVSTIIGTMVSLAMERYKFWGKLAFDSLLYLPIIIPDI